jgi:hypothetical protein
MNPSSSAGQDTGDTQIDEQTKRYWVEEACFFVTSRRDKGGIYRI